MGTDITGVFQKNENGRWIDISSEYNENRDSALFAWLALGSGDRAGTFFIKPLHELRGFPDDFEILNNDEFENTHPILHNDIHPPWKRAHASFANPSSLWYLKMFMGFHSFSWLYADEILNTTPRCMRCISVPIGIFSRWDRKSLPEEWQAWCSDWDKEGFARPDKVDADTKFVVVEWDYDFTQDFAYFVDEVRRLKTLHGKVRFVFGFG
ncbi:hypothetical protein [Undibacterium sp. TC9W]|uniref:hypothetical protein n=1 Tax=Undibacterium sp. TC9W TaxID=3413053 RepID=UPI003BF3B33C